METDPALMEPGSEISHHNPSQQTTEPFVEPSVMDEEPCPPVSSRGLYWSKDGETGEVIQPCPAGTDGTARWSCFLQGWEPSSPDLSECISLWILGLTGELERVPVTSLATDLAALTQTQTMYGGDIMETLDLIQGLRERLEVELTTVPLHQQRETLATELLQNVLLVANNLLRLEKMSSWLDLPAGRRAAAGSSLVLELGRVAALLADNIQHYRRFDQKTENVLSSVRVIEPGTIGDQEFPERSDAGSRVRLPGQELAGTEDNGATRLIFFLYDGMDRVLPSSTDGVRFLNSEIVSLLDARRGTKQSLTFPAEVRLAHKDKNFSAPTCMSWDTGSHSWVENGCQVTETNESHTTCICPSLGNIALLARVEGAGEELKEELGTLLGILLAVIAGIFLTFLVVLLTWKFSIKPKAGKGSVHVSCICKETENDYYPNINSSPTSTTLSDGTPTLSNVLSGSNYCLNKDCVGSGNKQEAEPNLYRPTPEQPNLYRTIQPEQPKPTVDNTSIYRTLLGDPSSIYRTIDQHTLYRSGEQTNISRAKLGSKLAAGVLPISHLRVQDPENHYFRPVSPHGHIYMEIDPVYTRLQPQDGGVSELHLSNLSEDDLRRGSELSKQSSGYSEDRPLIRSTIRRSNPVRSCQVPCSGHLRYGLDQAQVTGPSFETPITIALAPGGEQYVSLNLERRSGRRTLPPELFRNPNHLQ